jgi:hypothetical protein
MPVGGLLGGITAQAFSARTTMLGAGVALIALGLLASLRRPQVLTLAVSRDGLRIGGDLSGTGIAEAPVGGLVAGRPRPISEKAGDDR